MDLDKESYLRSRKGFFFNISEMVGFAVAKGTYSVF